MKFSNFRGKDTKKIFLVMAAISFAVAIVAIIAISQAVRFFRPKVEEVFSEFKETREKERLERIEKEAWEKEMQESKGIIRTHTNSSRWWNYFGDNCCTNNELKRKTQS